MHDTAMHDTVMHGKHDAALVSQSAQPVDAQRHAAAMGAPQQQLALAPGDSDFWATARAATRARAVLERLTLADCAAAVYQSSLLSYRSAADAALKWRIGDEGRFRYSDSMPDVYTHNAPWNDWTPPSVSQALFEAARKAAAPTAVQSRVRVLLAPQRDLGAPALATDLLIRLQHRSCRNQLWANLENGHAQGTAGSALPWQMPYIAFASVEEDSTGVRCLRFRRGAAVISTVTLSGDFLRIEHVGKRVLGLWTAGLAPLVFVHFDSPARMAKFCNLLAPTA